MKAKTLDRTTLKTSRLLDYCTAKNLELETGHGRDDWPLVILKELLDNAVDACEDVGTAPAIVVNVGSDGITVKDNGPGIPAGTVAGILDFSARVSSREHYVSPTRGAQGNALKTLVAIPHVLDGQTGRVEIVAQGIRHEITLEVDRIRQEPVVSHEQHSVNRTKGTVFTVRWQNSASSILTGAKSRFLQIADAYTFLNPHLTLTVDWFSEIKKWKATTPRWRKWLPSNPTSPHWYSVERFERLLCGYVSHDADNGRQRLVREVVAEFDGLTGTAKQKAVLEATGLARQPLSALRNGQDIDHERTAKLLVAMQARSKPVKAKLLGIIGREHLAKRFAALDCEMETFAYRKLEGQADGVPWIVETAFAATAIAFGDSDDDTNSRRIITGVNWSPAIGKNPFRQLGHDSLDSLLQEQRAGHGEPIVFLLHLACPRVVYTDRGKSAVVFS